MYNKFVSLDLDALGGQMDRQVDAGKHSTDIQQHSEHQEELHWSTSAPAVLCATRGIFRYIFFY